MQSKLAACWVAALSLFLACGHSARDFGDPGSSGSAGTGANSGGGGTGGTPGNTGGQSGGPNGGNNGGTSPIGAAGMAGQPEEPPDLCVGKKCDAPPADDCQSATQFQTYDQTGTCAAGECRYVSHLTACTCQGHACTPVLCKDSGTSSQCVACLANSDCSNGGTCSSAGACVCTPRFNGKHCEFQVFRGIGVLQGAVGSAAAGISHDGTVVAGASYPTDTFPEHAVRSVNGGVLQFIPDPVGVTLAVGCIGTRVDSAGTVLVTCNGNPFVYTVAGGTVPVDLSPFNASVNDMSQDGKVMIGTSFGSMSLAVRKANSVTSSLGTLEPLGISVAVGTNGDGSVVVGYDDLMPSVPTPMRWTVTTGMTPLAVFAGWQGAFPQDVSTDGKVIVGGANLTATTYAAVKWSGASLTAVVLGPGIATQTSADGSVSVGSDSYGTTAMLWDSAGPHAVQPLLGATPDLTSDWMLMSANAISDDGKIVVGSGIHGNHKEGWVAHLP